MVARNTGGVGDMTVLDIQLDQCLGMFGHKRQRHNDDSKAIGAGPADLIFGRRTYPFQRADPALIAIQPVEIAYAQFVDHGLRRSFDLPLVGIATLDDFFRQAMGGK